MPQIRIAAAAIETAIVGIKKAGIARSGRAICVADAMGQRVISADGHAARSAPLGREQQPVVTSRSAPNLKLTQKRHRRSSDIRVSQSEPAAEVDVTRRGAGIVGVSIRQFAWATG